MHMYMNGPLQVSSGLASFPQDSRQTPIYTSHSRMSKKTISHRGSKGLPKQLSKILFFSRFGVLGRSSTGKGILKPEYGIRPNVSLRQI